jgi:predicted regulator of Ras-like GTPase activity (Roadblock/LC7/MglB family)
MSRGGVVPVSSVVRDSLRGDLRHTSILDILQFLSVGGKTGELIAKNESSNAEAHAFFSAGTMVHVITGELSGMEALVEISGWKRGNFKFFDDILSPNTTIKLPLQHALLEAVRIYDERQEALRIHDERPELFIEPIRSDDERRRQMVSTRSSTDVLEDFLKVPGVTSAVVVGRDGFLIESAGGSSAVSIEDLGASLAHAINGIEEMGAELQVDSFQDLFVEYGKAIIICTPIGDAIVAITAPDASKLGIIRHKVRPLITELSELF